MEKNQSIIKNEEENYKNKNKSTKPLYKLFYRNFEKIASYEPSINESKNLIFINKYLYNKVVKEYNDKIKSIFNKFNNEKCSNNFSESLNKLKSFFRICSGIKIKNEIKLLSFSKSIKDEHFLLKFLCPISRTLNYFDYKNEYLSLSLKHYMSLPNQEIEKHFFSFLIREDNFENLKKEHHNIWIDSYFVKSLIKVNFFEEDVLVIKRSSQMENYLEFFEKRNVKFEEEI